MPRPQCFKITNLLINLDYIRRSRN